MTPILYPHAIWKPLLNHSAPGTLAQRNLVVLHSTEGTTAAGAIATFANSVFPHRVSAHFVIDRDGTVYQLLSLDETAWHASSTNSHSIGVEHVALSAYGAGQLNLHYAAQIKAGTQKAFVEMLATEAQYAASASLVVWLCAQMGIPCDRAHVRTHNEASPADGHTLCCSGTLSADRVVALTSAVHPAASSNL